MVRELVVHGWRKGGAGKQVRPAERERGWEIEKDGGGLKGQSHGLQSRFGIGEVKGRVNNLVGRGPRVLASQSIYIGYTWRKGTEKGRSLIPSRYLVFETTTIQGGTGHENRSFVHLYMYISKIFLSICRSMSTIISIQHLRQTHPHKKTTPTPYSTPLSPLPKFGILHSTRYQRHTTYSSTYEHTPATCSSHRKKV